MLFPRLLVGILLIQEYHKKKKEKREKKKERKRNDQKCERRMFNFQSSKVYEADNLNFKD